MIRKQKLLLIGLDCAAPELVFNRLAGDLPVLSGLRQTGTWGRLRSCDPPITIPAWTVMFSGKSPGELGIYGFRTRRDFSYNRLSLTSSRDVKVPRIWNLLSDYEKKSIVIGVPQTYPPTPLNGYMISGLLTPSIDSEFCYPAQLKNEVKSVVPDYMFDVSGFRNSDKDRLIHDIQTMTNKRFQLAKHLIRSGEWDCFIMVEIGLDRMQHAFWGYAHENSPFYKVNGTYKDILRNYYRQLDRHIGELIDLVDDNTHILIVSDHGAKTLQGGFCVNEWLIRNGYLVLKDYPEQQRELTSDIIDWPRTRAWAEGGYYARVNLNVKGREPAGTIAADRFESERSALKQAFEQDKKIPAVRAVTPQELYDNNVKGIAPDLMLFIDRLKYRAIGSVGLNTLKIPTNDTGPDHINHAYHGVFIRTGPGISAGQQDVSIYDVFPMIKDLFGIKK